MKAPDKVNLAGAFSRIGEYWSPRIAGEINDFHVKLAKLKGEFIWHLHEKEDEMFLVVKGFLVMRFRDCDVRVDAGEFIIVPRGVEHMPVAKDECEVVLFEPKGTLNTGNVNDERTVRNPARL